MFLNLQNWSFRPHKMAQNSPRSGNRCSRSSFGVPKKSPQRHKNNNSCSRSSFWPLNGQFWGPRGAEKSTFTMCLSRIYKRPKNRNPRLRGGNRNAICPPHLARGTSIIESKNHSIQESNDTMTQPHHIKVSYQSIKVATVHRYNVTTKACLAAWWHPLTGGPADFRRGL